MTGPPDPRRAPRAGGGATAARRRAYIGQANGGQGATVVWQPGQPEAGAEADDAELAADALDALDPAARARLEARLRAGADPSLARRAAFERAARHLAYAARPLTPPAAVRGALLERIRRDGAAGGRRGAGD